MTACDSLLQLSVSTGKAREKPGWKSTFLSPRPGRYWRNMQATLVWQLTEFIQGTYIHGPPLVPVRQNGYSLYYLRGTKEFRRVKREREMVMSTSMECYQGREIPSHAWPGQDNGLFQEPSRSRRHGRSTEVNLGSLILTKVQCHSEYRLGSVCKWGLQ